MERYERNLLLDGIDVAGQKKINATRVLVAGVGGLGSSVLVNLAAIGVERFGLIDFDVVSASNFNRQYIHGERFLGMRKVLSAKNWLCGYNSRIEVECFERRLEDICEVVERFDIIVDCLDNWESKFLLERTCQEFAKPLVHGGVEGYCGQVTTILPESRGLEGIFDLEKDVEIFRGIVAPIVSIIGAIQSGEVLNLILGDEVLSDEILMYDLRTNQSKRIKL